MPERERSSPESSALRARAEQQLAPGSPAVEPAEATRLLHELQVHQVELRMQNEELRRTRLELEGVASRYHELFDFAPIGYVTLGADGKIRELNHAGARLLGVERLNAVGQSFVRYFALPAQRSFAALLDRARSTQSRESCDLELASGPGRAKHVRLSATVAARDETLMLIAFEDVSETKDRELELERTERLLREADRRKDDFLALLSHELRNPLAPMRSSLFVLERADPDSEQAAKAMSVIARQVNHLSRLVDDLLDVTRITRGKIQLRLERVELGELVRRTMEDHRLSFDASGITLEGRFEPGLFWVSADAARMVQALSNLLNNAEKFTPRGGSVVVSVTRRDASVVLSVRDTGIGIDEAVQQHLFEPFVQAPQSMDRAGGGLGLGLAMVRGLIELHGGEVSITSQGHGMGADVRMTLPEDHVERRSTPPPHLPQTKRRRVLVIEDSKDAAESLRDALELLGHEVSVAFDGPSGIDLARTCRPEVVLCDIGLPGMNGYDVARAFRADAELRGVRLVALSGYALPEDMEHAAAAGFDQHVAKPPSLQKLVRSIEDAPV